MNDHALVVIDKVGASSGCACGGATDPDLPRFAGDLEWLRWRGVDVLRLDPRTQRDAIEAEPRLRAALADLGFDSLPIVLIDGLVVHRQSYPDRSQLAGYLDAARAATHL
jgi:hypothetical protein